MLIFRIFLQESIKLAYNKKVKIEMRGTKAMEYKVTITDLITQSKGKLIQGNENLIFENLCKDTREIQPGQIYLGFQGEKINRKYFI